MTLLLFKVSSLGGVVRRFNHGSPAIFVLTAQKKTWYSYHVFLLERQLKKSSGQG